MPSYREVFAVPEFRPLFAASSAAAAAVTVEGLALATLVYAATRSPLLSAMAMFGASFAQVIGAATLLSMADRMPPRATLTVLGLLFTIAALGLAIPGVPVWGLLVITLAAGLASSAYGGAQWGLVSEILPADRYILGRSLFNMSVGVMQILGYAIGGALVDLVSPRGALLVAAALYLASCAATWLGLSPRRPRAEGLPSVRATLGVNRRLWSLPARRYAYLALWVPNGLIVGCEALFIPYAPRRASLLFIAAAAGMLAGDTVMGRWSQRTGGPGWPRRCGCCWPRPTCCSRSGCRSRRRWRPWPWRRLATAPACCSRTGCWRSPRTGCAARRWACTAPGCSPCRRSARQSAARWRSGCRPPTR